MKKLYIIPAILILSGSLLFIHQGYKTNSELWSFSNIVIFSFGCIMAGWISILPIRRIYNTRKGKPYIPKLKDYRRLGEEYIIGLISLVMLVFNLMLVDYLSDVRTEKLWADNEKTTAYARIINIETQEDRNDTKFFADIEYKTEHRSISKSIRLRSGQHTVGDSIEIEYVVEYPDLFRIKSD
ncbi:MAG: hypothetical protein K8R63_06795 [Bacteroidales bacterium]|nr:hypothetical protein [Bacteroidales bacterium]